MMNTINNNQIHPLDLRLLELRVIQIFKSIDDWVAEDVISKISYFNSISNKEIKIYINSPGGNVSSGLAIYDFMQDSISSISTMCMGQASSMAQILLTAGKAGKRFAYPNAQIMMHQPMGNLQGQVTDIQIQMHEIIRIKEKLYNIIAKHTGKPFATISKDAERDFYFSAEEAVKYGLIDKIIFNKTNLKNGTKDRNKRKK